MRTSNNLSGAFHKSGSSKTLLVNLAPDNEMLDEIRRAEAIIRRELSAILKKGLSTIMLCDEGVTPAPKYLRQGSNAYGTLIDPLRGSTNYREADSDIGMYLPLEFIKGATSTPKLGAKKLRELTAQALAQIANANGWRFKSKHCCDRIYIRDDAHIDVTSYAIPRARHQEMVALAFVESSSKMDSSTTQSDEITWFEIPETSLLATSDGWVRSDAKSINNTIENASQLFGPMFKRVVRFCKALRDWGDDAAGPTSIALTLLTAKHLDFNLCRVGRDDLALLAVLGPMADGLLGRLPAPGNEDIDVLEATDYSVRERLAASLRQRQSALRDALHDQSCEQAYDTMKAIFGIRFPDAPDEARENDVGVTNTLGLAVPGIVHTSNNRAIPLRGNAQSA
ncbi:CBASS cGAMP synthase [Salinisphaera japonica]|uniref:Cyclic GMP-AMP synthase n=1 Tax=Salinisphaera japonica YTM-1 TaxID=1209778 RepID=A0A423PJ95_9GAMM|nr:hypothetical protein [Salinisphaera japonica]ROO25661.1 hypothetical protein SAJA_12660 [Salinisphaera japonica YTM-1]